MATYQQQCQNIFNEILFSLFLNILTIILVAILLFLQSWLAWVPASIIRTLPLILSAIFSLIFWNIFNYFSFLWGIFAMLFWLLQCFSATFFDMYTLSERFAKFNFVYNTLNCIITNGDCDIFQCFYTIFENVLFILVAILVSRHLGQTGSPQNSLMALPHVALRYSNVLTITVCNEH